MKSMLGKTIVITGVSKGLGRAMAEEFVRLGHRVAGCSRSESTVSGAKRMDTSPRASAAVPPNPSITTGPKLGSFLPPTMISRPWVV